MRCLGLTPLSKVSVAEHFPPHPPAYSRHSRKSPAKRVFREKGAAAERLSFPDASGKRMDAQLGATQEKALCHGLSRAFLRIQNSEKSPTEWVFSEGGRTVKGASFPDASGKRVDPELVRTRIM